MSNVDPAHYKQGRVECIDAIESALGSYNFQMYCRGQVFKYLWRMDRKGHPFEDAKKAEWYLNRMIKSMEADINDASPSV